MAGVAGALYVPQVGIINPSEFAPGNSIEVVIWVAVGGRGTLVGAALGAIIVNYLKTIFTVGMLAPYWLFVLGAIFVLVTIFLPRGVLGLLSAWRNASNPTSGVSPLVGEGQGAGGARTSRAGASPTPNPSQQGGGGQVAQGRSSDALPGRPSPQPAE
jgi:hypothetical protein